MNAGEDLVQVRGHDHQTLDALLQLHQGGTDGLEQHVVALDLEEKAKQATDESSFNLPSLIFVQ